MRHTHTKIVACAAALAFSSTALAQFDPPSGAWGKSDDTDLRVVAWNVEDGLCSSNIKTEGFNNWTALSMITAALRPDILLLQETGDNSGNGTGGGVDSENNLATTLDLFINGGVDPFRGGQVTAYVNKYAAQAVSLPYIAIGVDDNFNRNVIMSRYPFKDLNRSGDAVYTSFFMLARPNGKGYWNQGGPGIRGFLTAEIDLPDEVYEGDVVVGSLHFKSGSSQDDRNQRFDAGVRVAAFIDEYYNGRGTGTPDPDNLVFSRGNPQLILDEFTPVIWGGDVNEDEQSNGRKGPADWMRQAQIIGVDDGTDRDRGDSRYDDARDPFNNARGTRGGSKLDYIFWQDSIAVIRRSAIFNSSTIINGGGKYPPEIIDFPFSPGLASGQAADHRPVITDFILELSDGVDCPADWNRDGVVNASDVGLFISDYFLDLANGTIVTDFDGSGFINAADVGAFLTAYFAAPPECLG